MTEQTKYTNLTLVFETIVYEWEEAEIAIDPIGYLVITSEGRREFFDLEKITYYSYDTPPEGKERETDGNVVKLN